MRDQLPTIYPGLINAVLEAALAFGASKKELLAHAGIDAAVLSQSEHRIPLEKMHRLIAAAISETDRPDLGFYVGRIHFLGGLNLQLYMTTICHTFRDYLNLMPSVLKMTGDIGEVKIRGDGGFIQLVWLPQHEDVRSARFLTDIILFGSALIVDTLCVLPIPVIKAAVQYDEAEACSEIERFLGRDIEFGAAENCLYFDRASLSYPLAKQHYASKQGAAIPFANLFDGKDPSDKFWQRLRQTIVENLRDGQPSLAACASGMNMSPRTLQRKLQERSSSLQKEVLAVRMELAERYLGSDMRTVTEVAYLLGYSDQSSFSNAFKNWHGISPTQYQINATTGNNGV